MKKELLQEPINRNDRFWVDAVGYLGASLRRGGPEFLCSWIKEVLNLLESLNIVLVMPGDGCWGISIKDKGHYMFSDNDGRNNVYISKRLYEDFRKKNEYQLLAGVVMREVIKLIMCQRAVKKGRVPNLSMIRGEVARIERAFLGKEKSLDSVFEHLVELEMERRNVSVDSENVYVEGCAVSGEEIVAEIGTVQEPRESFIAELAPGEKKQFSYFTAEARPFEVPFALEGINFKDYCSLMKVMDNLFVEESVIEGPFRELLAYVRNLNYFEEYDNFLLKLLWMFVSSKGPKEDLLYNLYLIIDKYRSYFGLLEVIKTKYWKYGRYVKDYIKEIVREAYDKKEVVLESMQENTARMTGRAMQWFSKMSGAPDWFSTEKTPQKITKLYKKPKMIRDELSAHRRILQGMKKTSDLKDEFRVYNGIKRHAGSKVCELLMIRTHFWNGKSLFNRGERISIYTTRKEGAGVVEVLDVTEDSMIVSLTSYESTIPDAGFVKRLQEPEEAIIAQLEAIDNIGGIAEKVLKMELPPAKGEPLREITFFNPLVSKDTSQMDAVLTALGSDMVTLIQGPPGTGKTTVIAEIVLQYLKEGKKILLSSQTHNAVDNALENVMRYKAPDMGIGRVASREEKIVDPKIKKIWLRGRRELDQFELRYRQGLAIGATNVGTHTLSLMKEREFDVLVMDEGGKSNIVESILPMLLLKSGGKLVIVGDHMQGMPFGYDQRIVNLLAAGKGLKEKLNQSLFERMVKKGCKSIMLKVNYRSEPQIVELLSKLFYNGRLIPAKTVSRKAKSIVIVDTSRLAPIGKRKETEVAEGYMNTFEAELVLQEIKELMRYRYIATGIRARHIAGVTILAPYLFQVEEIRRVLSGGLIRHLSRAAIGDIINNTATIDSFQGRENDVVIISFTRSNVNPAEVGFLNELNRINVALSRARRKMILIGDFHTLRNTKKGPRAGATRQIFRTIYSFR